MICIETGIVYVNAREAERETGTSYKAISSCANKKQKQANGFHWEFTNT